MTPDGKQEFRIQLVDALTNQNIITSGGKAIVTAAGSAGKATLYDSSGAALSNPITPTRGFLNFFVGLDVSSVDLYIMCPGGQFLVAKSIVPGGPNDLFVDTSRLHQCMVIPVSADDVTANTETATGFTEPANALMLPTPFLDVGAIDATETIDVGTLSSDSGDANGYIAAASVATEGVVEAALANGAITLGALFVAQDSANAGDGVPSPHVSAGKSITVTTSAGSDTVEAFVHLPYLLAA